MVAPRGPQWSCCCYAVFCSLCFQREERVEKSSQREWLRLGHEILASFGIQRWFHIYICIYTHTYIHGLERGVISRKNINWSNLGKPKGWGGIQISDIQVNDGKWIRVLSNVKSFLFKRKVWATYTLENSQLTLSAQQRGQILTTAPLRLCWMQSIKDRMCHGDKNGTIKAADVTVL